MNPLTRVHRPDRRRGARLRRLTLAAVGVLAVGVAVAACGGSSTPGAATGSTTTTTSSPSASGSSPSTSGGSPSTGSGSQGTGLLAYSSCMRSHGVPKFPDPASNGGIPKETGQQLGVSLSQLQAAASACQHLIPSGESLDGQTVQTIPTQDQQDYLNGAACMRSHGFPNFPEPVFQNGQVEFPMLSHDFDLNSTQFQAAFKICQKDIPAGLPDSGSRG